MIFDVAVKLAVSIEAVDYADDVDDARLQAGMRPKPQAKNQLADVAGEKYLVDEAAGLVSKLNAKEEHHPVEKVDLSEDPKFDEFYSTMGPQVIEDVNVDDLIKRYIAWKLYLQVEKDTVKLRTLIL